MFHKSVYILATLLGFHAFTSIPVVESRKPNPSYIKACKISDPDADACMLASSQESYKHMIKGDKDYGIPPLDPFKIKLVTLNPSSSLSIILKNVVMHGLSDTTFKTVKLSPDDSSLLVTFAVPLMNFTANYDIKGRILVLPIEGTGPLEILSHDVVVTSKLKYKVVDKEGLGYTEYTKEGSTLTLDMSKMHFQLDNLFNGDKVLGEQLNKFLNENWSDASKEFLPAIAEVFKSILVETLSHISSEVPRNEMFLP